VAQEARAHKSRLALPADHVQPACRERHKIQGLQLERCANLMVRKSVSPACV
jgi:hypothetical protein